MQVLLIALILLAVLFGAMGVWLLVGGSSDKERLQLRLQGVRQVKEYELGDSLAEREKARAKKRQARKELVKKKAFSEIPALDQKLKKTPWAQRLSMRLRQAQMPLTVNAFLLICFGLGAVGGMLTIIWRGHVDMLLTPLAVLLLGATPYFYVLVAVRRRLKAFEQQFPDALDMLSSSVKGGMALTAAIQNVAEEMPDPTGDEFKVLADELTFGVDLSDALRHLAERVGSQDVQFFCTALMIQKETGGNLAEVLDGLQKTIRERFRILGQLKTLTAQGRLSGWIVGALPLLLGGVIYIANPDYMGALFNTTLGRKFLLAAGVLQLLGIFLIRKIVNIKV